MFTTSPDLAKTFSAFLEANQASARELAARLHSAGVPVGTCHTFALTAALSGFVQPFACHLDVLLGEVEDNTLAEALLAVEAANAKIRESLLFGLDKLGMRPPAKVISMLTEHSASHVEHARRVIRKHAMAKEADGK